MDGLRQREEEQKDKRAKASRESGPEFLGEGNPYKKVGLVGKADHVFFSMSLMQKNNNKNLVRL